MPRKSGLSPPSGQPAARLRAQLRTKSAGSDGKTKQPTKSSSGSSATPAAPANSAAATPNASESAGSSTTGAPLTPRRSPVSDKTAPAPPLVIISGAPQQPAANSEMPADPIPHSPHNRSFGSPDRPLGPDGQPTPPKAGNPLVLIAHPPLSAELGGSETEHTERAEGYTLSLEAGRFELALEVLRDDETEDVGRRGGGGRGRGAGTRGRNTGRNGGGRRRKEPGPEPEREVKILLRRPEKVEEPSPPSPEVAVDESGDTTGDSPFTRLRPTPQSQAHLPRPTAVSTKAHPAQPQQQPKQKNKANDDRSDTGRNRGRGKGRGGRGRGHYGGGFVLLQRPDTLVHHVGRGEFDRSGGQLGGGSGNNDSNANQNSNAAAGAGPGPAGWRRAYASNDEPPPPQRNKVVLLQRPR
ncbi:B-type regulatory subunit of protein phosphatase 2A (PP2A), Rts1p [Trichosporon asahii var. asahii CBS 2479]|uniref:B-type regulatory subunit of protein phosphatase 2A (PP2A), Rts1p n=1 Tax=Trichosporon asahii var. asahii (strain ATCC 90039 / CBS 2479 / JCM 2466 / KCTC 7840 / NBRC 103889/ NCYC 2677 / UAMH 7654) TaxID=1186058 RepID=J6ERF8_TRIAS|nr:B-type regulatory subunit of protein phosphatase 2A (PP2A), Rts1p [Trichosporon asahii var. asahii CBS 2479]EJT47084.1 B-type regulatory subunit of protein phosphatase 2A (PP2A), Rts1p [Trichosporon asahii var. asahii CBS 2479]